MWGESGAIGTRALGISEYEGGPSKPVGVPCCVALDERYHLPVMHTETSLMDTEQAPRWLRKEWSNLHHLKLEGVPILGSRGTA